MTPTPIVEAPPLAPNWLENIRGLANGLMTERSYVAPGCVLEQRGREIDHLLRSYQALTAPSPATGGVETTLRGAVREAAAKLSAWKDEHHDCDCPAGTSCGCVELREIIQALDVEVITDAELSPDPVPTSPTGTVSKDEIVSILKASLSNHDMAAQCILNLIALASPPPTGEPVAWMAEQHLGEEHWSKPQLHYMVPKTGWSGWRNVTPLYASPPPAVGVTKEALARIEELAEAHRKFATAREAMNAARPAVDATQLERMLYRERYDADRAAEQAVFSLAIKFAADASDILALFNGAGR